MDVYFEPPRHGFQRGRRETLLRLSALAAAATCPRLVRAQETSAWPADQPTPLLEAVDLDDRTWRLPELRGRAVLLNFWASWCEPCRAEMPSLQTLADFHGSDRLQVLAINYKEHANTASRFIRQAGLSLPVLRDPDGAIARAWGVRVFPSSILIDVAGQPRMRIRGELDWSSPEADRLISPLLTPA